MSDEVEAEMMHNPGINPGDFLGSAWRRSIPYVARGCNKYPSLRRYPYNLESVVHAKKKSKSFKNIYLFTLDTLTA